MSKGAKQHYSNELKDKDSLLVVWLKSSETMHRCHHIASQKYAWQHKLLGILSTGLSTLIATSLFISLTSSESKIIVFTAGIVSMLAATLMGVFTFLKLQDMASQHLKTVIEFQAVRREIEDELTSLREGRPKENYEHIRKKWTKALENAIPLPPGLYDKISAQVGDN